MKNYFDKRTGKALVIAFTVAYFGTLGGLALGASAAAEKTLRQESDAVRALEIEFELIERNRQR